MSLDFWRRKEKPPIEKRNVGKLTVKFFFKDEALNFKKTILGYSFAFDWGDSYSYDDVTSWDRWNKLSKFYNEKGLILNGNIEIPFTSLVKVETYEENYFVEPEFI